MFIEKLFINILSMSTIASIVFLLILLARRLFKNTISIKKLSLLWIMLIFTLIFPINFSSILSIKNYIDGNEKININMMDTYKIDENKFFYDNNMNISDNFRRRNRL